MTRHYFTIIYYLGSAVILLAINYTGYADYLERFAMMLVIISYAAGQYSMRFPMDKDKPKSKI